MQVDGVDRRLCELGAMVVRREGGGESTLGSFGSSTGNSQKIAVLSVSHSNTSCKLTSYARCWTQPSESAGRFSAQPPFSATLPDNMTAAGRACLLHPVREASTDLYAPHCDFEPNKPPHLLCRIMSQQRCSALPDDRTFSIAFRICQN